MLTEKIHLTSCSPEVCFLVLHLSSSEVSGDVNSNSLHGVLVAAGLSAGEKLKISPSNSIYV